MGTARRERRARKQYNRVRRGATNGKWNMWRWDQWHHRPVSRQVGKRLALSYFATCIALSACTVYEEPLCGRAHPGGGVTVRVAELADDGGNE